VNFFAPNTRKTYHVTKDQFFNAWLGGQTVAALQAHDSTATYVDIKDPASPRPQPGDLFLLAFNKAASKTLQPGMFSHIGFVTKITKLADGKEEWTTVAGGGGSARNKQEQVTEGHMIIDTNTGLTGPVANQPGSERRLQGWIPIASVLTK